MDTYAFWGLDIKPFPAPPKACDQELLQFQETSLGGWFLDINWVFQPSKDLVFSGSPPAESPKISESSIWTPTEDMNIRNPWRFRVPGNPSSTKIGRVLRWRRKNTTWLALFRTHWQGDLHDAEEPFLAFWKTSWSYSPEDQCPEHNSLEVWFRSFSCPSGWWL